MKTIEKLLDFGKTNGFSLDEFFGIKGEWYLEKIGNNKKDFYFITDEISGDKFGIETIITSKDFIEVIAKCLLKEQKKMKDGNLLIVGNIYIEEFKSNLDGLINEIAKEQCIYIMNDKIEEYISNLGIGKQ